MPLKVWNGSSWVSSTGVKVWNGSTWVTASNGRVWNGSSWVSFLNQIYLTDHSILLNVGSVFNGQADGTFTFNTSGQLTWTAVLQNPGLDYTATLDGQSFAGTSGTISGQWLRSGSASSFQIKITRAGTYGTITGASFGTWTTLSGNVTIAVHGARSDNSDNFTVEIRDVATSTVLTPTGGVTIYIDALAAGIN